MPPAYLRALVADGEYGDSDRTSHGLGSGGLAVFSAPLVYLSLYVLKHDRRQDRLHASSSTMFIVGYDKQDASTVLAEGRVGEPK